MSRRKGFLLTLLAILISIPVSAAHSHTPDLFRIYIGIGLADIPEDLQIYSYSNMWIMDGHDFSLGGNGLSAHGTLTLLEKNPAIFRVKIEIQNIEKNNKASRWFHELRVQKGYSNNMVTYLDDEKGEPWREISSVVYVN
ncbi:MAG: hypothetical protein HY391_02060 [Deltaproteobacteria bacterium]|nr:hypothetical protein [Deltaproteobacteria bacterium]